MSVKPHLIAPRWRLITPPHGLGESGTERQLDAMVETCAGVVSMAHDPGKDSRLFNPGAGHVLFSADGLDWHGGAMAEHAFYNDLTYGDGKFVAVGRGFGDAWSGSIALSDDPDAATWREVFTFEGQGVAVAYGAGVFVAVLEHSLAFSEDGEHWQWSQVPPIQALFFDVAFGGGRFVVAGVGATLSSSDGRTWEESSCGDPACQSISAPTGSPATYLALQQVDYVGGVFYAFGASGNLQSSDGRAFVPITGRLPDAAGGGVLLSLGQSSVAVSEDDGHSWREYPLSREGSAADCVHHACVPVADGLLVLELD